MKKFTMLSSVLASALMLTVASCSSSDDISGGTGGENAEGSTSYIAVNLKTVANAPTGNARQSRSYDDDKGGQYEDGAGVENVVTSVRFYFFNADGTPYILNNTNGQVNYVERTVTVSNGDQSQTVEGISEAVLVLNGESNVAPASMLTVVNPDINSELLKNGAAIRWSVMRKELKGSKFYDNAHFMMSNSTYEEAGNDLCTTQLTGKTYASSTAATEHPVDVYVERVNAKVNATVASGSAFETETNDVALDGVSMKDKQKITVGELSLAKDDGTSDKKTIFAYVVGWGLASENGMAELFKQIDTQKFTDEILGIYPWSTPDYHRSFWSLSVPFGGTGADKNEPVNYKFSDYTHKLGDAVYTLPNTPTEVIDDAHVYDNNLTKFVVAARLAYKDADNSLKPAEICEYKGQEFLGTDNLKKTFVKEISRYYKKVPVAAGEPDKYVNLDPSDITFTTTAPSGTQAKDYEVFATLANPNITLYEQKGGVWNEVTDKSGVYNMLQGTPAEVRKGGMAYYYTTIKHLGEKGKSGEPKLGEYGIVRNHSYQISLNSIKGFGTPVYDPDKKIVPTIPSDDKTYLAAKINVLSWRVVPSKVDLDKTEKK